MPIDIFHLSRKRSRRLSSQTLASPLQSIPDELLEQILAFCSQIETARVSSTCWRLARVATRVLYRHVKPATSEKALDLFITLCFHKQFLPFIQSCEMHISLRVPKPKSPLEESDFSKRIRKLGTLRAFPYRHILRDPLTLVASVLKKMTNLTKLELLVPEREVNLGYAPHLLEDCRFQLRYFDTNLRFDTGMAHFLRTQSALEDLRVYTSAPLSSLDTDIFPESSLPSLASLSWTSRLPIEVVRALTKGKSIHKVNISISPDVQDISPVIAFGPASDRVKIANFTFRDLRHPTFVQLEAMSFHFPNLVGLGIAVYAFSDDVGKDLRAALKTFHHLERLYIYDELHALETTTQSLFRLAKSLFNECNTLRRICFYLCSPVVVVEKITPPGPLGKAPPILRLKLKR